MGYTLKIFKGFSNYHINNIGEIYALHLNRYIKQQLTKDGYPCVTLRGDNKIRKTFKVHRLVALLFNEPQTALEVNHKDGNKLNNNTKNLEWVSHAQNIQHAWDTGLLSNTVIRQKKLSFFHKGRNKGKDNPKSIPVKLTNTGEIFDCASQGGIKYSISQNQISRCCNKKYGYKSAGKHPITNEPLLWEFNK